MMADRTRRLERLEAALSSSGFGDYAGISAEELALIGEHADPANLSGDQLAVLAKVRTAMGSANQDLPTFLMDLRL
jgi:hypothetical protein